MESEQTVLASSARCNRCGARREVYSLPDFLYGYRVLHTEDGRWDVFLDCFEDTAFPEIEAILGRLLGDRAPQERQVRCFEAVFGLSCDEVHGSPVDMARTAPACARCGSDDLAVGDEGSGAVRLPAVTHVRWNALGAAAREALVAGELRRRGLL